MNLFRRKAHYSTLGAVLAGILAVATLSVALWAGCGGGGGGGDAPSNLGTPAGTYSLTVTGTYTSGTTTVQHNVTLTVRVN